MQLEWHRASSYLHSFLPRVAEPSPFSITLCTFFLSHLKRAQWVCSTQALVSTLFSIVSKYLIYSILLVDFNSSSSCECKLSACLTRPVGQLDETPWQKVLAQGCSTFQPPALSEWHGTSQQSRSYTGRVGPQAGSSVMSVSRSHPAHWLKPRRWIWLWTNSTCCCDLEHRAVSQGAEFPMGLEVCWHRSGGSFDCCSSGNASTTPWRWQGDCSNLLDICTDSNMVHRTMMGLENGEHIITRYSAMPNGRQFWFRNHLASSVLGWMKFTKGAFSNP